MMPLRRSLLLLMFLPACAHLGPPEEGEFVTSEESWQQYDHRQSRSFALDLMTKPRIGEPELLSEQAAKSDELLMGRAPSEIRVNQPAAAL